MGSDVPLTHTQNYMHTQLAATTFLQYSTAVTAEGEDNKENYVYIIKYTEFASFLQRMLDSPYSGHILGLSQVPNLPQYRLS